jgi:putative flippase GtrA
MVTIAYGGPMRLVRLRLAPRALTSSWRRLLPEVSKFGAIGAVNLVLNYAVFNLLVLTVFVDGQLKANVAATVVATTSSYFMNRHWTYRDRPKSTLHREYALFFLFNLGGMIIELGVLAMAKYGLGITTLVALNVAKGFATVLGMLFRFWTYRTVVFRAAPAGAAQPGDVALAATGPAAPVADAAGSAGPMPAADLAQAPVAAKFAQLTGPLEAELDPPLDAAIRAELDAARRNGDRTSQSWAGPARAEAGPATS